VADEKAVEQLRVLRNRALRGVQERNADATAKSINRMAPLELVRFREDLVYLTTIVSVALDERDRQRVRVGGEEVALDTGSELPGGAR
jgi:hypothetical protein